MKTILFFIALVLLISISANAQTETVEQKEQTITTEESISLDQPTQSVSKDDIEKCTTKSKEECKRICEEKGEVGYHKNLDEMSKKECDSDCMKECCAKNTEETTQTDESSRRE